jgi:peroxiredoxin Q/BCP
MLQPGDLAPSFTAPDHEGKPVSLSDLAGKFVVLWFYPKADTPGCTREGCGFRDRAEEFAARNTVILGVSFDGSEDNFAFHVKYGFNFRLLSDVDRRLGVAYGAADDASASHARRIGAIIGPDGRIIAYYPKADATTFPEQALAAIPS